jgi:Fe-S cluster biosynthesis and repair protein YggX
MGYGIIQNKTNCHLDRQLWINCIELGYNTRNTPMTRRVYCAKLQQELDGLQFQPYPGELGQRIFQEVSADAWKQWLAQQTILINEYRLSSMDPKAKLFLREQMEEFLFGNASVAMPDAYKPMA